MQHRPLMRPQLNASGSGTGRCCCPDGSTHVRLSHVDPCGFVDDAVHDRLGRDIGTEPGMPVLLPVLGADDRRPLVVAKLEDLEQEASEAVVWPAEQPFVEDEDLERAILTHGLRDPSRTLLGIFPGLIEVGAPDVVRAHPRGACLLGKRAGKTGLSGACRPEEHDVLASRGEAAGRELAYEHAVETALLRMVDAAHVRLRMPEVRPLHEIADLAVFDNL